MVWWVATLFSSNMMDEMVELFLPIPVILGYRYHRDFSWTGSSRWYSHRTNSGATALSRLSRDHWSQSVALCVVSLGTLCSSQHDCWVSRSRNHPFSLGMGPETWECHIHILCIIMDRVHRKNHSDWGKGDRSSASWSRKRVTWIGWGRSDGDITKSSIKGGSLYVTTTTFFCFLTQKPWPSKTRSDHIILPPGVSQYSTGEVYVLLL